MGDEKNMNELLGNTVEEPVKEFYPKAKNAVFLSLFILLLQFVFGIIGGTGVSRNADVWYSPSVASGIVPRLRNGIPTP